MTLSLRRTEPAAGERTALRFESVDETGAPVRDFEVDHEKRMHLIVVRRVHTAADTQLVGSFRT